MSNERNETKFRKSINGTLEPISRQPRAQAKMFQFMKTKKRGKRK